MVEAGMMSFTAHQDSLSRMTSMANSISPTQTHLSASPGATPGSAGGNAGNFSPQPSSHPHDNCKLLSDSIECIIVNKQIKLNFI